MKSQIQDYYELWVVSTQTTHNENESRRQRSSIDYWSQGTTKLMEKMLLGDNLKLGLLILTLLAKLFSNMSTHPHYFLFSCLFGTLLSTMHAPLVFPTTRIWAIWTMFFLLCLPHLKRKFERAYSYFELNKILFMFFS